MDFSGEIDDHFEQIYNDVLPSTNVFEVELPSDDSSFQQNKHFQNELVFNKLLPYNDQLDKEADHLLLKIKTNLARCVMLRDIEPGCVMWANMLHKYIILYDLRFSKEDHINFIKLMFQLLTIPNLESTLIQIFANQLHALLKSNNFLSPKELELPWQPLYDLYIHFKVIQKPVQVKFHYLSNAVAERLESLIRAAKIYFPANATQEILEKVKPQISPFQNYDMQVAMKSLELFLPVQVPPENHERSHELWFHEFMKLWEVCNTRAKLWESNLMSLIAELAFHNIGYIDWEPYMPLMFTRFIQSFHLPVRYKKWNSHRNSGIDAYNAALWIASVLGRKSSAQMYLDTFFKTIETYFHSANHGSWLTKLEDLFVNISCFVVLRLYRERYQTNRAKSWKEPIPESHRLTDNDIDALVNSMMPIATIGIFNESQTVCVALHFLALMRPNIVIPNVLERIYPTLGSDIEPHKLISAMTCMITISRPLVQGSNIVNNDYAFQKGPLYVLPLLFASLSGIDPNDPTRVLVTFRLISTYVTMIPIVDCSKSTVEMSEDERLICEETSRFEDFVLQFMEKVFAWIEINSLEPITDNDMMENEESPSESVVQFALSKVFSLLLRQTSSTIFQSALNKLRSFIVENVLETKVAGYLVAIICGIFSSVDGHETLRVLLPFLAEKVLDAIGDDEDVLKAENLDNQLLYPLQLLHSIVIPQGDALLPHMDKLIQVMDKTVRLKSREGNKLSCFMLSNIMKSLTRVCFITIDRNLNIPDYPYIQDWGKTIDVRSAKLKTFMPGARELTELERIFERYLIPALDAIKNFTKTGNSLDREELQATLILIFNILEGCISALPVWDEPVLKLKPDENDTYSLQPVVGPRMELTMPDGSNVRLSLIQIMSSFQEAMLKNVEDDTESLVILLQIWQYLLLGDLEIAIDPTSGLLTNFGICKTVLENKMIGDNGWFPLLLDVQATVIHRMREMCVIPVLTQTHLSILIRLLEMSTSRYSIIRITAQAVLDTALGFFPNAYLAIVPYILGILKQDPNSHHHAYKGILYLIMQKINYVEALIVKHDWEMIKMLWSALVSSQPCEKLSVIQLKDNLIQTVLATFLTAKFKFEVPDTCLSTATEFWTSGLELNIPQPSKEEIEKGKENLRKGIENNMKLYNEISDSLFKIMLENNLHRQHRLMAMNFMFVLLNPEGVFSPPLVRFFVNELINESPDERKIAVRTLLYILKQLKKKHLKVKIDVPTGDKNLPENKPFELLPGLRSDNEWLQYNYDTRPTNKDSWDEPRYIHNTNVGYYTWPKELLVYAPSSKQPRFDKNALSEHDREIYQFFSNHQNVDKLIEYLSFEEHEDSGEITKDRILLFKGLFRNYDDAFLPNILPHLTKLVNDEQKCKQRCAAEIICGLIKGSKHWPYEMTEAMWNSLLPIIRTAMSNLTQETINCWKQCMCIANLNRDPNRLHWLLECLMEESSLKQSEASFVEYGRLMVLQGALSMQTWKVGELLRRLLKRCEDRLEECLFESVRDRLAATLMAIFDVNIKFKASTSYKQTYPEVGDFLDRVHPRLKCLLGKDETSVQFPSSNIASLTNSSENPNLASPSVDLVDAKREKAIRLFKIICIWILGSVVNSNLSSLTSFYRMFPIICHLENTEDDEELYEDCSKTIAMLAAAFTLPEHVSAVLEAVRTVSESSSWSSRKNCLEFLQVFVYQNMSILISNKAWVRNTQDIVLKLLEDTRLEVREQAAQVLSGLLHCTLILDQDTLLEEFKKKAKTKLGNRKNKINNDEKESNENAKMFDAARSRHVGVLGMCAYIQAHPYDVPKCIPPIFKCLSYHLNDPAPIPSTIRKTLNDFKHTHCDEWTGLQGLAEKFTEEQFEVMQDLTVPPSYCA